MSNKMHLSTYAYVFPSKTNKNERKVWIELATGKDAYTAEYEVLTRGRSFIIAMMPLIVT